MSETQTYLIGEAAMIIGRSIDTLRRWDKAGKLEPTGRDSSGRRLYTEADIEQGQAYVQQVAAAWAASETP